MKIFPGLSLFLSLVSVCVCVCFQKVPFVCPGPVQLLFFLLLWTNRAKWIMWAGGAEGPDLQKVRNFKAKASCETLHISREEGKTRATRAHTRARTHRVLDSGRSAHAHHLPSCHCTQRRARCTRRGRESLAQFGWGQGGSGSLALRGWLRVPVTATKEPRETEPCAAAWRRWRARGRGPGPHHSDWRCSAAQTLGVRRDLRPGSHATLAPPTWGCYERFTPANRRGPAHLPRIPRLGGAGALQTRGRGEDRKPGARRRTSRRFPTSSKGILADLSLPHGYGIRGLSPGQPAGNGGGKSH